MSDERVDPETLAAFLDDRLSGDEREAVLAKLVRSDEDYGTLLDISAVAAELERETPPLTASPTPTPTPAPSLVRSLRWRRFGLGLAAAIAASMAGIAYLGRAPSAPTLLDRVAIDATGGRSVVATAVARASAGEVRGSAAVSSSPTLHAFQLGIESIDVDLALYFQDHAAVGALATALSRSVSQLEGGSPVQVRLERFATNTRATRAEWRPISRDLRALTNSDAALFDLGEWTESARVAAGSADAHFFATDGTARLGLADRLSHLDTVLEARDARVAAVVARLRMVQAQLSRNEPVPVVASSLDSLAMLVR